MVVIKECTYKHHLRNLHVDRGRRQMKKLKILGPFNYGFVEYLITNTWNTFDTEPESLWRSTEHGMQVSQVEKTISTALVPSLKHLEI